MRAASLANLLGQSGLSAAVATGFAMEFDPFADTRAARYAELPLTTPPSTRTRLHELHPSLHCSVIGTCFGLRELRNLVVKFADASLAQAGDHTGLVVTSVPKVPI